MHRRLQHICERPQCTHAEERDGQAARERDMERQKVGQRECMDRQRRDVYAHVMPAERRLRLALIGGHASNRGKVTTLESSHPSWRRLRSLPCLYCFKCHAFIVYWLDSIKEQICHENKKLRSGVQFLKSIMWDIFFYKIWYIESIFIKKCM